MRPDNKFFSFMSLLGDIILLNFLFIITSIPIVTIGVSLTALYTSVKKRIRGKESYIARDYFRAWRENLKKSTVIWCVLLPFILAMVPFTAYTAANLENLTTICAYFLCFLLLLFILTYAFPLQATFVNKPLRIILNSLLTALSHLPYTLALIFITSIPVCLTLYFPRAFYFTFAYWLLLGFSLSTIVSVLLTERVFKHYMPKK
uniref:YesL family protein n=1 Tax=Enterocloster clostridioformis TaxID=1531 RepID=UPI0025A5647D|nr:YesL family protein [Enterocloster clostridioformis]